MQIKDSSKTIVCYGDSNTWGRIPDGERYSRSVRWTGVLQNLLGEDYEVISEGLGGRTFVVEDKEAPFRTGITHLRAIVRSHRPIDLIIVMLGTNDLKNKFNLQAKDIANHLEQTIKLIREETQAKILVISPASVVTPYSGELEDNFKGTIEKSKELAPLFKEVSEKENCFFLNADDFITSSKIDGFHLDFESHKKLAEVLKEEVKKILS